MTHAREKSRSWAPRALVVISCALALLAMQPAAGVARAAGAKPVLLNQDGVGHALPVQVLAVNRQAQMPRLAVRREMSFFTSAQRLHVLATVEIFQRLMMAELAAPQHAVVPVICFHPVCVEILSPVSPVRRGIGAVSRPAGHRSDQAFAIAHYLLAPPSA